MTEKHQIPKQIEAYLMTLLMEKNLDTLPPGMMADMLYDMYIRLDKYITANLMRALPKDKYYELDDKINKGQISEEDINNFFQENTDYNKVTEDTLKEFKGIFLGEKGQK